LLALNTRRVAAVVLAAGDSSRMRDRHKLLLPYDGEPLVRAPVRAAIAAGFDRVGVVVGREPRVAEALAGLSIDLIPNLDVAEGLSSSVRCASSWARGRADAMLLLLADEPGIRPDPIRSLVAAWSRHPVLAARCRYADRAGHPVIVPAPLPTAVTLDGDHGLAAWIASLGAAALECAVEGPAPVDVDTEDGYLAALARLPH
jgi:molybdenum cofactor cytidylyltransferase